MGGAARAPRLSLTTFYRPRLSPQTIKRYTFGVASMFPFAVTNCDLSGNPTRWLRPIKREVLISHATWNFFGVLPACFYAIVRLLMGAKDDFWLVGEFIGFFIVWSIFGAMLVPVICVRRFIAKRGSARAMRFLVNLDWRRRPPNKWTRLMLWLSGVDWREILNDPGHFKLRAW